MNPVFEVPSIVSSIVNCLVLVFGYFIYRGYKTISGFFQSFYGIFSYIKDTLQRTSPGIRDYFLALLKKLDYYKENFFSLVASPTGPWPLRLVKIIIKWTIDAVYYFLLDFWTALPLLSIWIGVVLVYWFLNWLFLPSSVDPTTAILIGDSLYEGLRALLNGIFSIVNLVLDLFDYFKVPFNLVVGFFFSILQLLSDFASGELTFARLLNLRSLGILTEVIQDSDSTLRSFNGRKLEQQVWGGPAQFGEFNLALDTDNQQTRIFAATYAAILGTINVILQSIVLFAEVLGAILGPYWARILSLFLNGIQNITCFSAGISDNIGCTIAEFIVAILNTIFFAFIKFAEFFGKDIRIKNSACPASSFPNVPCYCSTGEGGLFTTLPICPLPRYLCIEDPPGRYKEVEEVYYNGQYTRKELNAGPTRESACRESLRETPTGRRLGSDCREICHIDTSGEGWWVQKCRDSYELLGHCAGNGTLPVMYDDLSDEQMNRHLTSYMKTPWVTKSERRRLLSGYSRQQAERDSSDPPTIISREKFDLMVTTAYQYIISASPYMLDCSEASLSDYYSLKSIMYSGLCVTIGMRDLYGDKNDKTLAELLEEKYPRKHIAKLKTYRHLEEEDPQNQPESTQFWYILRSLAAEPTFDNLKKVWVDYVDAQNTGVRSALAEPLPIMHPLNQTFHVLMHIHRVNLAATEEPISRRNLQVNLPEKDEHMTYICPGSQQRVFLRMSFDPNYPGLESCKLPTTWDPLTITQYVLYILESFFLSFSPVTYLRAFTSCWKSYTINPQSYPLTYDGIIALLYNDENYLRTKTFCFPLYRSVPRIPSLVWSFLTYVEESCDPTFTIEQGKLDRCLCPMYITGPSLNDFTTQWIAFIPTAEKYRLINTYRSIQITYTLLIPLWASNIWTSFWATFIPWAPTEFLYAFNSQYARGASQYWNTPNDLTPANIAFCYILTLQSTLYAIVWFFFPLVYFTGYSRFLNHIKACIVEPFLATTTWIIEQMRKRRAAKKYETELQASLRLERSKLDQQISISSYVKTTFRQFCEAILRCPWRTTSSVKFPTQPPTPQLSPLQQELLYGLPIEEKDP